MTTFELLVVALLIYIAISIDWENDFVFQDTVFKVLATGIILSAILGVLGLVEV